MRILIVLTSHHRLGDTGKKTGFWFDEFATPYYIFKDAGINQRGGGCVLHRLVRIDAPDGAARQMSQIWDMLPEASLTPMMLGISVRRTSVAVSMFVAVRPGTL